MKELALFRALAEFVIFEIEGIAFSFTVIPRQLVVLISSFLFLLWKSGHFSLNLKTSFNIAACHSTGLLWFALLSEDYFQFIRETSLICAKSVVIPPLKGMEYYFKVLPQRIMDLRDQRESYPQSFYFLSHEIVDKREHQQFEGMTH